jgi:hypothetical protein
MKTLPITSSAGQQSNEPTSSCHPAHKKRTAAAVSAAEEEASAFPHPTNGDEELYAEQAFAGNFSKTLPHDPNTGLVEPFAYEALINAVQTGTLASFDLLMFAEYCYDLSAK